MQPPVVKVRVLCSVRRSDSAHSSYSLWSLGRRMPWRRPRSRWGFYHLWNSRSHPQTCRCNTTQVSLPPGDFYFENFENAELEMKFFLGSVSVCVCVWQRLTAAWVQAFPQTRPCRSFPSSPPQLKHKHTAVTDSALSPNVALQAAMLRSLTLLGVGVGLDLEDDGGDGVSVHVVERIGDPLRRKQIEKKHLLQWWRKETDISEIIGKLLDL